MSHGVFAGARRDGQPKALAIREDGNAAAIQDDDGHGPAEVEVPDQAFATHLPEQLARARHLGLQHGAESPGLLQRAGQLLEAGAAPLQAANLELPELPRERAVPHRHPVVQEREPAGERPRATGKAHGALDLELEARLEAGGVHQATETSRGLARPAENGGQVHFLGVRLEHLARARHRQPRLREAERECAAIVRAVADAAGDVPAGEDVSLVSTYTSR